MSDSPSDAHGARPTPARKPGQREMTSMLIAYRTSSAHASQVQRRRHTASGAAPATTSLHDEASPPHLSHPAPREPTPPPRQHHPFVHITSSTTLRALREHQDARERATAEASQARAATPLLMSARPLDGARAWRVGRSATGWVVTWVEGGELRLCDERNTEHSIALSGQPITSVTHGERYTWLGSVHGRLFRFDRRSPGLALTYALAQREPIAFMVDAPARGLLFLGTAKGGIYAVSRETGREAMGVGERLGVMLISGATHTGRNELVVTTGEGGLLRVELGSLKIKALPFKLHAPAHQLVVSEAREQLYAMDVEGGLSVVAWRGDQLELVERRTLPESALGIHLDERGRCGYLMTRGSVLLSHPTE